MFESSTHTPIVERMRETNTVRTYSIFRYTRRMKVQVKPLRSGGVRICDRQIQSLQPIDGVIRVYRLGPTIQVCLSAHDDQQVKPLLPYLYDAQLVTMHGNGRCRDYCRVLFTVRVGVRLLAGRSCLAVIFLLQKLPTQGTFQHAII